MLELGDLPDRLVEQVAVVGDDEHRAVEVLDELLDDPPASDVEVGLGLVEQQHVGRLHEAGGERDELALAAAERARGPVEVLLGEPEIAQVTDGVAAGGVGAEALDQGGLALEHAAHAVEVGDERRVGELGLDAPQLLLERGGLGPRGGEDLAHGALVAVHHLVQVGDAGAAAQRHRAGVRVLLAGQHLQQRRLARAVGADQADARPRAELEIGAVEDQAAAEGLRDAAQRERRGGGSGDGHDGHDGSRGACSLTRELAVRMTNGCQEALDGSVRKLTGTSPSGQSQG